jgi:hypothetical protein
MSEFENIKAVFLDIDGTLANSNRKITDYTKEPLKRIKEKGIYVVLCSGRCNKAVCEYSKQAFASDFAISSNGAHIYNYITDEDFYKDEINYDTLAEIWKFCKKNNIELVLNAKDIQYGNGIFFSDLYKDRQQIYSIKELEKKEIYQVIINSRNYDNMAQFESFIKDKENMKIANYSKEYKLGIRQSKEPYYMFINNRTTDKGSAINKFLEAMNIKKEEAICFGDRMNDITMFNSCGKKVAMQNADDDLKRLANYVTSLSNDENGVADFLNKYL